MPTIKLKSGSYRAGRNRYTPTSEPFVVSDKMAEMLNCEIVPTPTLDEGPEPELPVAEPDLDELRAEALGLGIDIKKQWSATKLLTEIAAHGQPSSE